MKKTLILLGALAGLAAAAEGPSMTASQFNTWSSELISRMGATTDWSLSFKVDEYNNSNYTLRLLTLKSDYYLIHQYGNQSGNIGTFLGLSAKTDSMKNAGGSDPGFMSGCTTDGSAYSWSNADLAYGWITTSTGSGSGVISMTDAVITLSSSSSEGARVSVSTAAGSTFTVAMTGVTFNARDIAMNAAPGTPLTKVSNVTWTVGGENIVVPEPATATLSLLALAGLAARRRRVSR